MQRVTANLSVLAAEIHDGPLLSRGLDKGQAHFWIKAFLRDLSSIVWSANGESIQAFNDKLICTFYSADDAVIAATTMHQFAYARPSAGPVFDHSMGLQIRIGTGVVVREGNRLYGDAVTFAEKKKPIGHPFRTLISEATRNYLSREHVQFTQFVGRWPINADHHQVNVFEYIADGENTTLTAEYSAEPLDLRDLDLILGATLVTVNDMSPVCTIGRQANNDIILKYPRVSRRHAKVEKRGSKFLLIDTSANGTYIRIGNLETLRLRNDELQLIGKGMIFPGREATSSSPGAIHYQLR